MANSACTLPAGLCSSVMRRSATPFRPARWAASATEAYIPDERGAAEPLPFATAGPLSSPRMTLIAFSAIWVSVMADPCGDEGEAARDTNAAAFIALA